MISNRQKRACDNLKLNLRGFPNPDWFPTCRDSWASVRRPVKICDNQGANRHFALRPLYLFSLLFLVLLFLVKLLDFSKKWRIAVGFLRSGSRFKNFLLFCRELGYSSLLYRTPKLKGLQMNSLLILAEAQNGQNTSAITSEPVKEEGESMTKVPADANSAQGRGRGTQGFGQFQILLIVVMIVFVFMMFRGPRKKQQEHRKMVQSLQKNDRVRTIGGIYGTVVDVKDDEIVLKIDESNNTKMRISPNAIGTKLSEEKS
jgi:preprotein translocase subunit YajC